MKRERKGILKNRWAIAVLLAESLVFIDAIRAVTQVPILAPKIRGIAKGRGITSFPANATTTLVVTLLL